MARPMSEMRKISLSQISWLNKDDRVDSILASSEQAAGSSQFSTFSETLNSLLEEVAELKKALTAPDGVMNKFAELQAQSDRQANVTERQQEFLETEDRKEREKNFVVLGLPDENESLHGAIADAEKIGNVWVRIGAEQDQIVSYQRLGARRGDRPRPVLLTMTTRDAKEKVSGTA